MAKAQQTEQFMEKVKVRKPVYSLHSNAAHSAAIRCTQTRREMKRTDTVEWLSKESPEKTNERAAQDTGSVAAIHFAMQTFNFIECFVFSL